MAAPRYRTLSHALANREDEPAAKRVKWARESQRRSDESGESYDGPIVHVEDYGATSLETNGLPQFFHSVKFPSFEKEQAWKECQKEAVSLVQEHHVEFTSVGIIGASMEQDAGPVPVLVISVPSEEENKEWKPLIISICKMLHAKDCLQLGILILAPDLRPKTSYFSVEANDPLVNLWPKLREPVTRILGRIDWNVIGLVRAGETDKSTVPTIVIGTEDITEPQWSTIQTNLKSMCRAYGAGNLDTMVYHSQGSMFAVSKETPSGVPVQHLYDANIQMGQSIGADDEGSGTLGGHVRLVYPEGQTEVLGLTNYHVVRPNHKTVIESQLEVKNGAWDADYDNGVKHLNTTSPYSAVQAPSLRDHADHYTAIQERLEEVQKRLDAKSHWKAAIEADQASQLVREMYNTLMSQKALYDNEFLQWCAAHNISVAQFNNIINTPPSMKSKEKPVDAKARISAQKNDLLYGRVKYTSGHRSSPATTELGFRLDWALIKPVSGVRTVGVNRLPPQSEMPTGINFQGHTRVHGFAEDSELQQGSNRKYIKIGRTTGLTIGMYNCIELWVKPKTPPNSENPQGGDGIITREHSIIHNQRQKLMVFSSEGDSGSWIINAEGRLMGMIWGAKTRPDIFSYFTSVDVLLADIKMRTGCARVELI